MLISPDGRIKMTEDEIGTYRGLSGIMSLPKTIDDFNASLTKAADDIRGRIASGNPRMGDNEIEAQLIEDYMASPHGADIDERHRQWIDAGCPIGEEAMRRAGLTSPALDRLQAEREAKPPELSCS